METIGIICEYNPFHNGHIYHIDKIKKLYPDSRIILVMSGNFCQRGDVSLINKWDKTRIALDHGIDLVLELPFVFATQSADIFAHGAIQILGNILVDRIIFGSECDDINYLNKLASVQINNPNFDSLVKKYMNLGNSYPNSINKAIYDLTGCEVSNPNDILGISYIKESIIGGFNIKFSTIKRTSDYHSELLNEISSASAIRKAILDNKCIDNSVPSDSLNYINNIAFINNYFEFLKYKIISSDLSKYMTVDSGIISRIKDNIYSSNSIDELISKVKTKRYTYNRIKRMLVHILCSFTKEEASLCKDIHYIRVLGFNNIGKSYLNSVKKNVNVPIISNFSGINDIILDIEFRSTCVYSLIFKDSNSIINSEKNSPVIK